MLVFIYVVAIVYLLSINLFGILNLYFQKKENLFHEQSGKKISDFKLIITGALGGALGIFVSMFIMKYKLKNGLLMVLMPVLATVNIFLIILALKSGYYRYYIKTTLSLSELL